VGSADHVDRRGIQRLRGEKIRSRRIEPKLVHGFDPRIYAGSVKLDIGVRALAVQDEPLIVQEYFGYSRCTLPDGMQPVWSFHGDFAGVQELKLLALGSDDFIGSGVFDRETSQAAQVVGHGDEHALRIRVDSLLSTYARRRSKNAYPENRRHKDWPGK
jgi:hypothetical protein